jgi:choline dehydrogenase-like flavoprotein
VHYSGTLPMRRSKVNWALSEKCQSYDIANMFVVDGSAMPFLPAKNLTYTLMANAARVGDCI